MKTEKSVEKTLNSIWQFKVMEYVAYLGIFAIPLYIGMSHWFPAGVPKALLIIFFTITLGMLYLWGSFRQNDFSFQITPLHGVLAVLLSVLTMGALLGADPHNSFFGTWIQSISLVIIYTVSIFACLIGFLIRRNTDFLHRILTASFVSSVVVGVIAYLGENFLSELRGGSTLGNSSYAGAYLLFNICFGIGLLFWYQKRWQKILVVIGELIIIFCPIFFNGDIFTGAVSIADAFKNPVLFLGQANAAIIGTVVSIAAIAAFFGIRSPKKWLRVAGFIFFTIILGGVFTGGIILANKQSALNQSIVEKKTENRFVFWDIARQGFVELPIWGNGFNNYTYTFHKHFRAEFFKTNHKVEPWTYQPHNMLWEYLSTTGILGTLAFLVFFVWTAGILFVRNGSDNRQDSILKLVLAAALIGYFIQNLFGFDVPVTYLMLFLVIGIALGSGNSSHTLKISRRFYVDKIAGGLLIITGTVSIIYFVAIPWHESKQWFKMTNFQDVSSMEERTTIRGHLQKISMFGGVADTAFMGDLYYNFYKGNLNRLLTDVPRGVFINELISIEDALEYDLSRQPLNLRARMATARFIMMHMFLNQKVDQSMWDRAYTHTVAAHELSPANPEPYFVQANLFLMKNDIIRARAAIRAGIAIAPEYGMGYELARDVNKRYPDMRFMNYVKRMNERWVKD